MSDTKEAPERWVDSSLLGELQEKSFPYKTIVGKTIMAVDINDAKDYAQAAYSAGLASAAQVSESEEAEFEKWLGVDAQSDFADGAMQAWAEQEKRKRRALASAERQLVEAREALESIQGLMREADAQRMYGAEMDKCIVRAQEIAEAALRGEKKV